MGYHSKNSGGGSRFSRKTLALVSALGIGASASIFVVNADAAPEPREKSAYSDAARLGRNIIYEKDILPKLQPIAEGSNVEVKLGQQVNYVYKVNAGFPDDANYDNVTAQRWLNLKITQDPAVPFNLLDGKPQIFGLPAKAKWQQVSANTWEVKLGIEYADQLSYAVNNPSNYSYKPEIPAWTPPSAQFEIKIPATVTQNDRATFVGGKLEVLSGRVVDVELKDEPIVYSFISNDGQGTCTWDAEYHVNLQSDKAGYWAKSIEIGSNPAEGEAYEDLRWSVRSNFRPKLIHGRVYLNGEEVGMIRPVLDGTRSDVINPGERTGEYPFTIGKFTFPGSDEPVYASDQWYVPSKGIDPSVKITYRMTSPCGSAVDQKMYDHYQRGDRIADFYPRMDVADSAIVQNSGVYFNIVRPPEDSLATAEMKFKKPAPKPEFAVSKNLADGQDRSVSLNGHSFTVRHDITVTNKSETDGKFGVVSDTINSVPGFKVQSVTVDDNRVNTVPVVDVPFTVSGGDQLRGKNKRTFKVDVTYVRERPEDKTLNAFTKDEVDNIGTCADNTGFNQAPPKGGKHGIVNTVVLGSVENDADKDLEGVNNNWDCVEPAQPQGSVSVGDFVWFDENHDGEQNNEEKGLAGVTLELYGSNDQPVTDIHGNIVESITTDSTGKYEFKDLPVLNGSDVYTVKVANFPSDYEPTVSGTGKIPAFKDSSTGSAKTTAGALSENGAKDNTLDFGFVKKKPETSQGSVSVGDFVWFDENHDGEQNNEEKGLAGVTLELYGSNDQPVTDIHGNIVESITTDSTGKYEFKDLPVLNGSDVYTVKVANFPSDYEPTVSGTGKIPAFKDSSTGSAKTTAGALSENGAKDNTLDFGFVKKEPETPKPEPEVAKFAVSKVLSETGKKFGNQSLAEQDNGEITVKHLIRVKNISDVAGKSAKVYDTPGTPAGMKIKSVMLADNPVELTAGGYKLSDGVELTPGAEAGFNVTVVYEPEQIPVGEDPEAAADEDAVEESDKPKVIFKDKATDLEKLGVCTPDNGTEYGIDEKLGFYNAVHMEGDADEEKAGNNWDCVSVNPPAEPERPIVPEFPINPTPPAPGEPRTPGFGWLVPLLPLIPFLGGVGSSQGSSAPVVPAPQNSPAPAAPQTVTPVPAPKPGERPQLARTGASVLGLLVMAVLLVVAGLGVMRMRRKEQ
ncbi:hypothetical protein FRC0360_00422 [Corynebacterium diphtheriae]|nr:hypothetical protein FRC0360_00422 [Corynebacterium diphtheriae]